MIAAVSKFSPEQVNEPFVTSSTVTPGNFAKAALMRPPHPLGQLMPVTVKLTVVEASSVSVAGSTVDVAAASVLSPLVAGSVLTLDGCALQPTASSTKNAARCFSFIGPPFKKRTKSPPSSYGDQHISLSTPTPDEHLLSVLGTSKIPIPPRKRHSRSARSLVKLVDVRCRNRSVSARIGFVNGPQE